VTAELSTDVIITFVLRSRHFFVGVPAKYKPRMYIYKYISVSVTGYKVETTVA